ncbi:hypothetical protein Mal48_38110 [Thalassoglobus polymorphus]|uniref:Uncharacterized protein n=1 Tax=Thalassoglobus polymorphus TaxID=2527994 RepID=A0A517QSD9_9PLAN|nr:hypothetical protein Mal48_38110 [Thalassoglobus polymorphus]
MSEVTQDFVTQTAHIWTVNLCRILQEPFAFCKFRAHFNSRAVAISVFAFCFGASSLWSRESAQLGREDHECNLGSFGGLFGAGGDVVSSLEIILKGKLKGIQNY